MNQAMRDVFTFMTIGQPDYVAECLRPPNLGRPENGLSLCSAVVSAQAAQMAAFAKQIGESDYGKLPSVLGARLMLEELGETLQAMAKGDVVEFADGLADLAYVVCWTALAHGVPLGAAFAEVHRSNMAKFPVCETCCGSGRQISLQEIEARLTVLDTELAPCGACGGLGRVVVRDAGGKVQKPPGWTPPDIRSVLDGRST